MNIIVPLLCCAFFLAPLPAYCCDPPVHFLFGDEAQQRLDSLQQCCSDESQQDQFILLHNLAFRGSKDVRDRSEKLFKSFSKDQRKDPIMQAYGGSLRLMKIRDRGVAGNALKGIGKFFGVSKSAYDEAREAFAAISEAVEKNPGNDTLRILRATAATEIAEHLPEVLDSAELDLLILQQKIDPAAPGPLSFFVTLTWAKYCYKTALVTGNRSFAELACEYVLAAGTQACVPYYQQEAQRWEEKIDALLTSP